MKIARRLAAAGVLIGLLLAPAAALAVNVQQGTTPWVTQGTISGPVTANQGTPNAGGAAAWPVNPDGVIDGATFTGTASSAATLVTLNTQGYGYLEFQLTSVGTGNIVLAESSNDGTPGTGASFETSYSWQANQTSAVTNGISPSTTNIYVLPVSGATMRLRVSTYGSGTVTVVGALKRGPAPPPGWSAIQGTTPTGAADTGTPVKIGGVFSTSPPVVTTGQRVNQQMTSTGGAHTALDPTADVASASSDSECTTACASLNISGAHNLYGFSGSATVTGWFLLEDSLSCAANGTITPMRAWTYQSANTTMGVSFGDLPKHVSTGLSLCFSTTGPYTATSSATAFIGADYK